MKCPLPIRVSSPANNCLNFQSISVKSPGPFFPQKSFISFHRGQVGASGDWLGAARSGPSGAGQQADPLHFRLFRKVQVVQLRFFGGIGVEETAEVLKVSSVTVMRDWSTAKAGLYRELTNAAADGSHSARSKRQSDRQSHQRRLMFPDFAND